jgi:TolB-like protein
MAPESEKNLRLEIGHVLFLDIVGYSKLLIEEQEEGLRELTEIVLATAQVAKSTNEQLVKLPTGDGMALVFRHSSEEPVRCALEIARALKQHPKIAVRMGVHSGPVSEVSDVSGRTNIAGPGINMAQRVMDCGDAGHILLSKRVAEDLESYRQWAPHLYSLGECEVKHGLRIQVVNLYTEELGNRATPQKLHRGKERTGADGETATSDEGFWVAVLPFKYGASNADVTALAEGLSEEIVTGLSRFSYLKVIARGSTSRYAGESHDVRSAGKELGARYVMEGSLRQAGTKLRLAVQLVDAVTGAHLWAENYERSFSPGAVFELQDDLVPRIVSSVADAHGILPHTMSESLRSKTPDQLSPYEAVLRSFGYGYRMTAEEHAVVQAGLERAVEQEPAYADAWAMLSLVISEEYAVGFNPRPDPLGRALQAARRATDAAPSSALAHNALARALFYRREFKAFRLEADRSIEINPFNGPTLASLGTLLAYAGGWEHGCAQVERAARLNPNHPGWYWFPLFYNAYRKGDYRGALEVALKINLPEFFHTYVVVAAASGQLGECDQAGKALQELLRLEPHFAETGRDKLEKWFDQELIEHILDGLRKAGLKGADEAGTPAGVRTSDAGAVRADEGFWVAVLPFKYSGSDSDLTALAEGLTEEIVTGLSRFSYLKVIARGSTARYANESVDIRLAGKELGARYVMEGSLRQVGSKLRLAVQLVDALSGAHLWAENYERPFSPETMFELQDDLVPRIVSTVADQYGALVHSMSESLRGRSAGQYSAQEAVLRAFGYQERFTLEEHAEVRDILEAAIARTPDHSDCLAELACVYWHEYVFGYNPRPDSLGRAQAVAQRAVASAPTNPFAHYALAAILFFQKDFLAFRTAADRALALNPMDSSTAALLGTMIAYTGDWKYGVGLVERAKQLNPHHPGWYHYAAVYDAYRRHDYRGALINALKVNMPGYYWPHASLAAIYGQLGDEERARAAVRELQAILPNFSSMARELYGKWNDPEFVEHLLDGLRKAGLAVE